MTSSSVGFSDASTSLLPFLRRPLLLAFNHHPPFFPSPEMRSCLPSLLRQSLPRPSSSRLAFNLPRPSSLSSSSHLHLHRPYSTPPPSTSSTSTSPPLRTCWSCHQPCPPTTPLCSACSAIQPVLPPSEGGPNLFQLLGLPEKGSFAIDEGELKMAFLKGSKDVHPDGFKGKGEVSSRSLASE